jgi:hypothetical protein
MTEAQYNALIQKLPRMFRELVEGNTTFCIYIFGLSVCLYLVSRSGRIWPMSFSTIAGPLLASLAMVVKPVHPFENLYARFDGASRRSDADRDATARMLIEVLKSKAATKYVVKCGLFACPLLTALVLLLSRLRGPLDRSFDPTQDFNWMMGDIILIWPISFGIGRALLLRWALAEIRMRDHPPLGSRE